MVSLPAYLAVRYHLATTREIRSWSFGQVNTQRATDVAQRQKQRGTLDDQGIFGPLKEFECACGKYRGPGHQGMICDRCGVKVASPSVRRERFGHVELGTDLRHPLGAETDRIAAFPVLPAVYVASLAGVPLAKCYEALMDQSTTGSAEQAVLDHVAETLLPAVEFAHAWQLLEASVLARALALLPREERLA